MYHMVRAVKLLSIDPGAVTGWALWDGPQLLACGVASPDDSLTSVEPAYVVIECPTRVFAQSTAASIIKLARVAGRFEERYARSKVVVVEPREWKGTIDGDIMAARIKGACTPRELAIMPSLPKTKEHNMLDAIGLGKWALKQPFLRAALAA